MESEQNGKVFCRGNKIKKTADKKRNSKGIY
jgi:hypothetical protein